MGWRNGIGLLLAAGCCLSLSGLTCKPATTPTPPSPPPANTPTDTPCMINGTPCPPSPTPTSTNSPTSTPSATPTSTATSTSTATPSRTLTPTGTPTNSATPSATGTPSSTPTVTFTSSITSTPTPTGTPGPGDIITVAGNGTPGYSADGVQATQSELYQPNAVAVDSSGNLYIADTYNNRIRKVDTSGTITTIAGNGTRGETGNGGSATSAEISEPAGIAVDSSGNVYFTESNDVREVSGGTIQSVAGYISPAPSCSSEAVSGPATCEALVTPIGIAVLSPGTFYFADYTSQYAWAVSGGNISQFAGDGGGGSGYTNGEAATSAYLDYPEGVAANSAPDVYIASLGYAQVLEVNSSGAISAVAGNGTSGYSGDGGPATSAELDYAVGLALDSSGDLYIADGGNQVIRMVNTSGVISTFAGSSTVSGGVTTGVGGYSGDGGPATSAKLSYPYGVAVDSQGDVFIADYANNRIREVIH